MSAFTRHIVIPSIAPLAVVGLYLTPVSLIGCAPRGLLALGDRVHLTRCRDRDRHARPARQDEGRFDVRLVNRIDVLARVAGTTGLRTVRVTPNQRMLQKGSSQYDVVSEANRIIRVFR